MVDEDAEDFTVLFNDENVESLSQTNGKEKEKPFYEPLDLPFSINEILTNWRNENCCETSDSFVLEFVLVMIHH